MALFYLDVYLGSVNMVRILLPHICSNYKLLCMVPVSLLSSFFVTLLLCAYISYWSSKLRSLIMMKKQEPGCNLFISYNEVKHSNLFSYFLSLSMSKPLNRK
jgi:hypothetical protein